MSVTPNRRPNYDRPVAIEPYDGLASFMQDVLKKVLESKLTSVPEPTLNQARNCFRPGTKAFKILMVFRGRLSLGDRYKQLVELGPACELLCSLPQEWTQQQRKQLTELGKFFAAVNSEIDAQRLRRHAQAHISSWSRRNL